MKHNRFFRNVQLGIKSLMLHKLRSLLTVLGVVFGVGSVVAMLSVGEGASRQALAQIERLGATNLIIESAKPKEEREASSTTQRSYTSVYGLMYDDEPRLAQFPHVVRTVPAKVLKNREARLGERSASVRLVGTTPDWFDLNPRTVLAGRVLSQRDQRDGDPVCVLAEKVARQLLPGSYAVGQVLRVGTEAFRVVGIIATESGEAGGIQTADQPFDVYTPINVVRNRFGDLDMQRSSGNFSREEVQLHRMIVQVDDVKHVESTAEATRAMLKRFHKHEDYLIRVPLALLRQAEQTQRMFSIVLASIASISLLVGGIGIMNIMLASVTERTREIGVRRAIGAKRRQIVGQFLIETVVLSLIGGLIGVLLGITVPSIITATSGMPTVVTWWSVALSVGISALVGVVFGMYPAYRAACVDPIIALRHE